MRITRSNFVKKPAGPPDEHIVIKPEPNRDDPFDDDEDNFTHCLRDAASAGPSEEDFYASLSEREEQPHEEELEEDELERQDLERAKLARSQGAEEEDELDASLEADTCDTELLRAAEELESQVVLRPRASAPVTASRAHTVRTATPIHSSHDTSHDTDIIAFVKPRPKQSSDTARRPDLVGDASKNSIPAEAIPTETIPTETIPTGTTASEASPTECTQAIPTQIQIPAKANNPAKTLPREPREAHREGADTSTAETSHDPRQVQRPAGAQIRASTPVRQMVARFEGSQATSQPLHAGEPAQDQRGSDTRTRAAKVLQRQNEARAEKLKAAKASQPQPATIGVESAAADVPVTHSRQAARTSENRTERIQPAPSPQALQQKAIRVEETQIATHPLPETEAGKSPGADALAAHSQQVSQSRENGTEETPAASSSQSLPQRKEVRVEEGLVAENPLPPTNGVEHQAGPSSQAQGSVITSSTAVRQDEALSGRSDPATSKAEASRINKSYGLLGRIESRLKEQYFIVDTTDDLLKPVRKVQAERRRSQRHRAGCAGGKPVQEGDEFERLFCYRPNRRRHDESDDDGERIVKHGKKRSRVNADASAEEGHAASDGDSIARFVVRDEGGDSDDTFAPFDSPAGKRRAALEAGQRLERQRLAKAPVKVQESSARGGRRGRGRGGRGGSGRGGIGRGGAGRGGACARGASGPSSTASPRRQGRPRKSLAAPVPDASPVAADVQQADGAMTLFSQPDDTMAVLSQAADTNQASFSPPSSNLPLAPMMTSEDFSTSFQPPALNLRLSRTSSQYLPPTPSPSSRGDEKAQMEQMIARDSDFIAEKADEMAATFAKLINRYSRMVDNMQEMHMHTPGHGERLKAYGKWMEKLARWANRDAGETQRAIARGANQINRTPFPEVSAPRPPGHRQGQVS